MIVNAHRTLGAFYRKPHTPLTAMRELAILVERAADISKKWQTTGKAVKVGDAKEVAKEESNLS